MSELCRLRRSEGYEARDDEKQEKALALSERQGEDFCPHCARRRVSEANRPQCGRLLGRRCAGSCGDKS